MRFLLDTHALLWRLFDDPQLSMKARGVLMGSWQCGVRVERVCVGDRDKTPVGKAELYRTTRAR